MFAKVNDTICNTYMFPVCVGNNSISKELQYTKTVVMCFIF